MWPLGCVQDDNAILIIETADDYQEFKHVDAAFKPQASASSSLSGTCHACLCDFQNEMKLIKDRTDVSVL